MNIEELKHKCRIRNWCFNNFTAYVLEVGITPYWVGDTFDIAMPVIGYWLHHEKLSRPVDAFFLTMRKIYLVHGISLSDLF